MRPDEQQNGRKQQPNRSLVENALAEDEHQPEQIAARAGAAEAQREEKRRHGQRGGQCVQFAHGGVDPHRGRHGHRQRAERGKRSGRAEFERQPDKQGDGDQPPEDGPERDGRRRFDAEHAQNHDEHRTERAPLRVAAVMDQPPARQGILVLAHVGHVGVPAAVDEGLVCGQKQDSGNQSGHRHPQGDVVGTPGEACPGIVRSGGNCGHGNGSLAGRGGDASAFDGRADTPHS